MPFLRFLFKTLINLFVFALLLLICIIGLAIWTAPKLAPKLIDTWIEGKTGFSTSINKLDFTFLSGNLNMENISIANPPYYQNRNFLQLKQLLIKVKLKSLWKKPIVFDKVVLDIDRLTWVRNTQGSTNLNEFADSFRKATHWPKKSPALLDSPQSSNPPSKPKYLIKKLVVQINSITMVGFPNETDSQNFPLNYNQEFTDVTDIEDITNLISTELTSQGITTLSQKLLNPQLLKTIDRALSQQDLSKTLEKLFTDLKKKRK